MTSISISRLAKQYDGQNHLFIHSFYAYIYITSENSDKQVLVDFTAHTHDFNISIDMTLYY